MNASGMIVKIKRRTCIVVTAEGEYREVPLPAGDVPRLGQTIKLEGRRRLPYLKQFMAVASLFIILMAGMLYLGETPPAAAYLTIDINPSIELAVSTAGKVISARAMDSEGEKILAQIKVKGKDLREVVGLIVAQAVTDNYIEASGENVILATLTVAAGAEPLVDLNSVYEAIKSPVESSGMQSDVIIEPVEPELREEADASGISTGRYLLLKKSGKKGLELSISDITSMSLGKLEKEKDMNLIDLVAGEDTDNASEELDNSAGQKDKTTTRGIYVERKKPAEDQDKAVEKVTITEEKKSGRDTDAEEVSNKASKGSEEAKQGKGNKNQGNEKPENNPDKRDNSKHDR